MPILHPEEKALMKAAVREAILELDGPESRKALLKEALHEWMEEKFASVGKWTMRGILVMAFGMLVYFVFWTGGWTPPGR